MRYLRNRLFSLIIAISLLYTLAQPALAVTGGGGREQQNAGLVAPSASEQIRDITDHWAAPQIKAWVSKGLANGYPDGTFRPDKTITRAEFVTLVNKALGYSRSENSGFSDVKATDWFAGEIAKARAAGYISGYEDGTIRPGNQIRRQETAVMLARVLKLSLAENLDELSRFKDAASIAPWARGAVAALIARGCMNGYPDQTYQPDKPTTRAEAISVLNRVLEEQAAESGKWVAYDQAGTYGPATGTETISGNVTIGVRDVTLQNLVITGNLLLAEGIGDGNAALKNVTVKGNTIIKGGGSHSVVLENCYLPTVTVDQDGVRVVASGKTAVNVVRLESGATLVEITSVGAGFEQVIVSQVIPAEAKVTLEGSFAKVEVAAAARVEIACGTVGELTIAENAQEAFVNVDRSATVEKATFDAKASMTGDGKLTSATVNVSGTTISQTPATYTLAPGISASVGGKSVANNTTQPRTTNTFSTVGGGGGGGGSDTAAPAWTATYPRLGNVTATSVDLLVKASERGLAYYVVLGHGATAPSAVQVKDGQDATGTAVAANCRGNISLGAHSGTTATIIGLSPATSYDIYVVAEDNQPNIQASAVKLEATTIASLNLTSSGFPAGGDIPDCYSFAGGNTSIPLSWNSGPEGTMSYALVMYDPNANNFVHWMVKDIPVGTTSLAKGASDSAMPEGTVELPNTNFMLHYFGPSPPARHQYIIKLYALSVDKLDALSQNPDAPYTLGDFNQAVEGRVLACGELSGYFAPNQSSATIGYSKGTEANQTFTEGLAAGDLVIEITGVKNRSGNEVEAGTTNLTGNIGLVLDKYSENEAIISEVYGSTTCWSVDDKADTITITRDYLNILSAGNHNFSVVINDEKNNIIDASGVVYVAVNPILEASQIEIHNNGASTGFGDYVYIGSLLEGDVVKVYDSAGGADLLARETVASGCTCVNIQIAQLGTEAGTVFVSVTRMPAAESRRIAKGYAAEFAGPTNASVSTMDTQPDAAGGVQNTITWTDSISQNVTSYYIFRYDVNADKGDYLPGLIEAGIQTYIDTSPVPGTDYVYLVYACDGNQTFAGPAASDEILTADDKGQQEQ